MTGIVYHDRLCGWLLPQLQEDIPNLKSVGKEGSPVEWLLESPDLTLIDLFLRVFVTNNIYVYPLPGTLHELKTWIREACAKIGQQILCNVRQELNISLMLLEPIMALTLHFIRNLEVW